MKQLKILIERKSKRLNETMKHRKKIIISKKNNETSERQNISQKNNETSKRQKKHHNDKKDFIVI